MRRPIRAPVSISSTLALLFLLPSLATSVSFDCNHIRTGNKKFDLSPLKGPHSVKTLDKSQPPAEREVTWTVDVCKPLRKTKGVPKNEECENGTRVCGIEVTRNPQEEKEEVTRVIPVAGNYGAGGSGRNLDPKFTRLKSQGESIEGLRMELHGGKYAGKEQKAVINFRCDEDRSGNENLDNDDDKEEKFRRSMFNSTEEPEVEGPQEVNKEGNSLNWVGYELVDDTKILSLEWHTKYACEDYEQDEDENSSEKGSWGFFTWFIIIVFLGTAAYLVFGSWLNYNRYGARGWDLLPHGDTIRDIPYLIKDWWRAVMDTISGTPSRGGYSAV
ncbi:MAG: hypothetical protein Q9227_007382 [Pyrenula ochraceoflavens]